jgi:hypothetical protein
MLTASTSAPADLSGRKRKSDPGVDVDTVVLSIIETLRGEQLFSSIEEDDWEVLTKKVRKNPTVISTSNHLPVSHTAFIAAQNVTAVHRGPPFLLILVRA